MAMSKAQKEEIGTWLYRGLAIYFLWNIYLDVASIDVIKSRVDKHENEIGELRAAVFTTSILRRSTPAELKAHNNETAKLQKHTEEIIDSAKNQITQVDSSLARN